MCILTVYFDDPWWVGVIEDETDGALKVCRYVFGSEPGNGEILEFVQRDLLRLLEQTTFSVESSAEPVRRVNPKRANREAARQLQTQGVLSKAQETMRLQLEQFKQTRQVQSKTEREALADYKRQKAREKALARKKGH